MPNKINFNVPFLDVNGQPVTQNKIDPKKSKMGPNGPMPHFITDKEGNIEQEEVTMRAIVVEALLQPYPDDENVKFEEKQKRGKLARKVQTSSTAKYNEKETLLIKELAARSKSTLVLLQLSDLIDGNDEETQPDAAESETTEKAA